jgi:hypothetical protein
MNTSKASLSIVRQSPASAARSARGKIKALVAKHLELLAMQRRSGILIRGDGSFHAGAWQAACQRFMDEIVLPQLTVDEAQAVLRMGLSELSNDLIEKIVRAENRRQELNDRHILTARRGASRDSSAPSDGAVESGLIIRPNPLERILSGSKDWEMRSVATKKRGTIALIRQGAKAIIGVADIVDCLGPLSKEEIVCNAPRHGIEESRFDDPEVAKWRFAYVLENVRRLSAPVPCRIPSGAVTFVTINRDVGSELLRSFA